MNSKVRNLSLLNFILVYLVLFLQIRFVDTLSIFALFSTVLILFLNNVKATKFDYIVITLYFIWITISFIMILYTGNEFKLYNLDTFIYFSPIIYLIGKINSGNIFMNLIQKTYNYSFFLLCISLFFFKFYFNYQFQFFPYLYRFNFDVKGNLYGPISLLVFFPTTLLFILDNKIVEKSKFKTITIIFGILFIFYFGYLTLTRSLIFVILPIFIYVISRQIFSLKTLILLPIVFSLYLLTNQINDDRNLNDISSGRDEEVLQLKQYLNLNSYAKYIPTFYGSTKKSIVINDFIGSNNMMHNGFYHLVLQFGYLISFLVYIYLIYLSIYLFFRKNYLLFSLLLNLILISVISTIWFSFSNIIILSYIFYNYRNKVELL